jgi:hypothetical protein
VIPVPDSYTICEGRGRLERQYGCTIACLAGELIDVGIFLDSWCRYAANPVLVTYIFEFSDLVLNSFDNMRSIHRFDEANITLSCSKENVVSLMESFV